MSPTSRGPRGEKGSSAHHNTARPPGLLCAFQCHTDPLNGYPGAERGRRKGSCPPLRLLGGASFPGRLRCPSGLPRGRSHPSQLAGSGSQGHLQGSSKGEGLDVPGRGCGSRPLHPGLPQHFLPFGGQLPSCAPHTAALLHNQLTAVLHRFSILIASLCERCRALVNGEAAEQLERRRGGDT